MKVIRILTDIVSGIIFYGLLLILMALMIRTIWYGWDIRIGDPRWGYYRQYKSEGLKKIYESWEFQEYLKNH